MIGKQYEKWTCVGEITMSVGFQVSYNWYEIDRAIKELKIIKKKLKKFSLDKVVWDIENLEKHPPWGKNISDEISDLSNYFITSDGEDFITIFMHALEKAKETGEGIAIRNI